MSEVKVNKISPRTNCGTVQLGDSGDTITIPAGATITNNGTQTGFGRTGAVDWQTTPKTATFTAASGEGYFINSGSAITANLPAGSAGAIVAFSDYARNFATHNFTISPNGSEKIGGEANDLILNVNGQALTLVYVDGTKGWINVQNAEDTEKGGSDFIEATGGTIKTSGNFKTHIFTGPGSFVVSSAGTACGSNKVDYFVVGGGGSGSAYGANNQGLGGGGAGGFRVSNSVGCVPAPTMSPLVAPNSPSPAGLAVPVQSYPITVGAGGAAATLPGPCNTSPGASGSVSTFSSISSAGGGYDDVTTCGSAVAGGSGGGGGRGNALTQTGGAGNTPPVSPPQGQNGGGGTPMPEQGSPAPAPSRNGGGGGGAGATGGNGGSPGSGAGGAGSFVADAFIGGCAPSFGSPGPVSSTRYFAGGGGGAGGSSGASGGAGGGGAGVRGSNGTNGTTNTGGGGGGSNCTPYPGNGGTGGSGIVMIRYKFQ
jgi:hypothetical protein